MTRNGSDYSATSLCFTRTRTAQFALELMYSWDRAAAIAFCQVAEGTDGGPRLTDKQTKRLSTKLKVLLTLRSLDAFGDESEEDSEEFDVQWASHRPSFASLVVADVGSLVGPATGTVAPARIEELTAWFRSIVDDVVDAGLEDEENEE